MPRVALLLVIVWFASLFVFRSAYQWWRTGSTGVKGFSGSVGSLEWSAGAVTTFGLICGATAPLAALYGWKGGALLFSNHLIHLSGGVIAAAGLVGALLAQVAMGASWRVGVDETERTDLVMDGIFSRVRNPFFSFVLVSTVGLVLLLPNPLAFVALSLTTVGVEIQVRAVEEPYLLSVHGAAYKGYASRTGRFWPRLGRLGGRSSDRAAVPKRERSNT